MTEDEEKLAEFTLAGQPGPFMMGRNPDMDELKAEAYAEALESGAIDKLHMEHMKRDLEEKNKRIEKLEAERDESIAKCAITWQALEATAFVHREDGTRCWWYNYAGSPCDHHKDCDMANAAMKYNVGGNLLKRLQIAETICAKLRSNDSTRPDNYCMWTELSKLLDDWSAAKDGK